MVNRARWGKPDSCSKQPQVGCKCKLARKLWEPLVRSATVNKTSVNVEELYQGQERLLGVESSYEEAESQIEKVESLIDQLTEDTKDSIRHLHEVVAKLTVKVKVLTRTLDAGGNNTRAMPP
ncbi:hypothetical protein B296_00022405 [Ensete ventricosum]|uniref:Uncharacterized protein n=1 Tax=Ensete ventricosum TaxID=4639 RepID=A0A426Z3L3_ENSVE|nr:hypothetical protein B296_00022405 [Ensete ventricosum]